MNALKDYKSLYKTAFISTIIMLTIIPIQILVFALTKLPTTTIEWFSLFKDNLVIGFFHADFFILINNILISIIYLAFYHTLKEVNKGVIQIGIALGLIGISAYISSNKTFEILKLSYEYFSTNIETEKIIFESAGKACLLGWQGTAFDTYYVLNGIALFCISILMYKSKYYSKATATWGLFAAIFMIIPSTAGTIGLIFSLLSLIPWYVFSILYAKIFVRIGKEI
ncbi:DUF4386 family protein [Treponema zuelzerae]|uniref:DUF4386 family protein n=1 Tax=Teretinema zuelzerae TaxID=156 RepID=A0AAE3JLB3_9SPIR|nr:DUF4386 family protein [Teretinema zuelzerae]MCD1655990.1 DUF4386 family protein [Teretinema zuelzerae]MCD1656050.1 DUF4386 family protein [Teretinema zuelzerae]MCD1656103.1 DUF4386 family protein [Teretinema zuelzerae]